MLTCAIVSAPGQKEWIFTYYDNSNTVALSFGANQNGMQLIVDKVSCSLDPIITAGDFTSTMKPFCVLWTSADGRVDVYFDGSYRSKICFTSVGHSVPGSGRFRLGGKFLRMILPPEPAETFISLHHLHRPRLTESFRVLLGIIRFLITDKCHQMTSRKTSLDHLIIH